MWTLSKLQSIQANQHTNKTKQHTHPLLQWPLLNATKPVNKAANRKTNTSSSIAQLDTRLLTCSEGTTIATPMMEDKTAPNAIAKQRWFINQAMLPNIKQTVATKHATITPLLAQPLLLAPPPLRKAKEEIGGSTRETTCSRGSRMAYQVTTVTVAVAVMRVTATLKIVATGRLVHTLLATRWNNFFFLFNFDVSVIIAAKNWRSVWFLPLTFNNLTFYRILFSHILLKKIVSNIVLNLTPWNFVLCVYAALLRSNCANNIGVWGSKFAAQSPI